VRCLIAGLLLTFFAPSGQVDSLAAAVDAYVEGRVKDAIRSAALQSSYTVNQRLERLVRDIAEDRGRAAIEASALLHTEVFISSGEFAFNAQPTDHLSLARTVIERLLKKDPRGRDFARRWYLLMVAHLQGEYRLTAAATYLDGARNSFPGDAEVLTASGCLHEQRSQISSGNIPRRAIGTGGGGYERVDVRDELRRAAAYYRRALEASPGAEEARLRLGRVLHRLDDLDGAGRELEAVRAATGNEVFKYLASIFLASVEGQRGRHSRAAELYVEALQLHSAGQAPFVGLGRLLQADGQPDEAWRVLQRMLGRTPDADPWWSYLLGQWWHLSPRLAEMRAKVKP
jgi:tetratricopeptide (TPR) repeat protein